MLDIISSGQILRRLLGNDDLRSALDLKGAGGIVRRYFYMMDGVEKKASLAWNSPQLLSDYTRTKDTKCIFVSLEVEYRNTVELALHFMFIGGWCRGISAQDMPEINFDKPWLIETPKYPDDDDSNLEYELTMMLLAKREVR